MYLWRSKMVFTATSKFAQNSKPYSSLFTAELPFTCSAVGSWINVMILLRFNKSEPGLTIRIVGASARVHALFRTRAVGRGKVLPLREPKSQLLRHLRVVLVVHVVEHAAPSHFHLQPSAHSLQPRNPTLTHKLQGVQFKFTGCPFLRHDATCVSGGLEALLKLGARGERSFTFMPQPLNARRRSS